MRRLMWPLPALLAWACAWAVYLILPSFGLPGWLAAMLASLLGVGFSVLGASTMRRLLIGVGFPLSLAVSGLAYFPAWGWLLPLAVLLLIYPINAWRDAPLFPTPANALRDLAQQAPLPNGAQVLDAGCGLGDGLKALRLCYPDAQLHGLEWSWPLAGLCRLRCPWARVRQGDIWRASWSGYDMVYLFQRPESMARAAAKAQAEMRAGSWLVSLEFAVAQMKATAQLTCEDGRVVWLYRMPVSSGKSLR